MWEPYGGVGGLELRRSSPLDGSTGGQSNIKIKIKTTNYQDYHSSGFAFEYFSYQIGANLVRKAEFDNKTSLFCIKIYSKKLAPTITSSLLFHVYKYQNLFFIIICSEILYLVMNLEVSGEK